MLKKILITGAGGMLGREITDIFSKDKKYAVFGTIRSVEPNKSGINYIKADLRKLGNLKKIVSAVKPDIIIHCAALVNLDKCEKNKREANLVHIEATKILASYKKNKTKFVYISTDSVFNGKTGNYTESSRPNPLNHYSQSKLLGEKAALAINKNSLVVRMCIYGFHIPPGNSLAEWALDNFALKKPINGFTDAFFNPVYTKQLAQTVKYILEKKKITGILNIGSEKPISKCAFLKALAKNFKINPKLIVVASIDSSGLATARPKNTVLNTDKLKRVLGGKILKISDGLAALEKDYLKEFGIIRQ
ncbi:MAG: hypothetical protein A2606_02645 [Candidatus Yanofskybacteria bacterium RIFOXYD1_FULL_42_10]|uniref:RmlD-like substrate binding domain-containing protein n=2 Tax=Parcubacteria group TaxID=1794811 RepID=A0A1F8HVU4_9BACT|nr:MAG: hypothetical protein UU83_C0024G0005 [Candidatus Jorgensenbacteria bacterium GW2011_GWF2_41_8]OGN41694.1 MAG: hypothetical protein A2606_02645 [Candidatus Yanofskybacteria bacterium RIFOXYD1_FULL_42_10]